MHETHAFTILFRMRQFEMNDSLHVCAKIEKKIG